MIRRRDPWILVPVVLAALALLTCSAEREESVAPGAVLYRRYCASCHGVDGRGGGPVASSLAVSPGDLTTIERGRGEFDGREVAATIDGRQRIDAHGPPAMPVWGEVFAEELAGEPHEARIAAMRVVAIVDHLRSIQR